MKRASKCAAIIACVSLGALSIVAVLLFSSAWPASGQRAVNGLRAPVAVYRDAWGIPYIFAETDEDASFALGWVHAEHRLWQMETMRRLGAGRLAEIFGQRGLPSDRWMRTLGLHRLAERDYAGLSSETKRQFDAYARGVNAWLTARSGLLPPEFLLFRVEPEPWTPADSLVWLKLMALRLSGNRYKELLRARLAERLTPQQLRDLWPEDPPDAPTTLAATAATGSDAAMLTRLSFALPETAEQAYGASNAWVVAGSKTASGKPILANDPHLAFTLPAPWYLTRIVTRSGELAGATSPGVPAVVLGHNKRIAWGITSSHVDVEDVFFERVDPDDPTRYDATDGPLPFVTREEVIRVRNAPAETLVVRSTRHGPVISDLGALAGSPLSNESGPARVVSLSATYLSDNDRTAEAIFALNRAGNWHEFLSAAKEAMAPQQNVFYADVDGHIGFTSAGRIPRRPANRGGGMPGQGGTEAEDWLGFIPYEDMPKVLDPSSGRLVNANNRPMPLDYPWAIEGDWDAGFRAARIEDRLAETNPQTVESTAALQLDSVSLMARRLVPLMLDGLPARDRHSEVSEVMERLRSWDGTMRQDSSEPLIFVAWLREVVRVLCQDELGPAFNDYWDYRPRFVEVALTKSPRWCDDISTGELEDCPSRLALALTTALEELSHRFGADTNRWRWGDAHKASFSNPTWDRIPIVGRLAGTSLVVDGGNDTINRAASRISDPDNPFAAVHGASFRGIYDLAELGNSQMVLATGQSGNPFSRHYRDMMPLWRDGLGIRLNATRHELERDAESSLRLVPLSQPSRP